MHVLIAYDISQNKTRQKLFSFLRERGLHSQKSVFECELSPETLAEIHSFIRSLKLEKQDSVLFYPLCRRCARQGLILGQGLKLIKSDWLII